jgi:RNA polymerase-interacting CarD/CdnL/TRCF family regulator
VVSMRADRGEYSKGDWIVHAYYGVGKVENKDKKVLEGEKREYLKVKTTNGVYWLPEAQCEAEHIRPIASNYQLRKAIGLIKKEPNILPKDHNQRRKQIQKVLHDVSLYARAGLLRDLYAKRVSSKLNYSEEEVLNRLRKVIVDEWEVVKDLDRDEIKVRLEEALAVSAAKFANAT